MDKIIAATLKTLEKSRFLLEQLSDEQLQNASVSPYCSSIGCHIRHILDFYDCIFNVDENNVVNLTARSRNKAVECACCKALSYLANIENSLKSFNLDIQTPVKVIDDLGMGKVEMPYTMASLFSQANSHTIHHYAIINYILEGLKISFNDSSFGYNPTTPKNVKAS
ncbi:hypothetical protein FUA26_02475 [Seonamhaeicola algicola]|uniref:DinB family protein n=1 Tax=Seonamhaeicola algicola TaxID=1719036 RepID=A0A5C7B7X9_9FLAO|nr:hypothetical protein [Seonamhaeicola algicola]TXE13962.1 hypothetical protein FUA26_02475 [Seonamhaeicola algicola]